MNIVSKNAKELRVAVIGVGRMGMRHLQAAKYLGMNVCAVVDRSEQSLAGARSTHGVTEAQCFTDVDAMLAATKPAGLVVATTAPTHAPFVLAGAKAGVRHILCEKPMAVSLAECDAMLAACRTSQTALAVNHQMRFMPQYTDIKAMIGSEELGALSSIIVAGSNFGLAMNACHYFEMYRYLADGPARAVQAWFETGQLANPRGAEFEDRSGRLIVWGNGTAPMYMDFAAGSGWGMTVVYNFRQGQVIVDELLGEMRVVARRKEHRELPTTRYGMPADLRTAAIEPVDAVAPTAAVWAAVLDGRTYPDGEAGAHAVRCLVAAHASHESGGREVRLDDPALPRDKRFPWA